MIINNVYFCVKIRKSAQCFLQTMQAVMNAFHTSCRGENLFHLFQCVHDAVEFVCRQDAGMRV